MARYFDGCTLPGGHDYGPDDNSEPVEDIELCDCGEPATVKCGREVFCKKCNDEIDADAELRAAMAKGMQ